MRGIRIMLLIMLSWLVVGCGSEKPAEQSSPPPQTKTVETQNYYSNGQFKVGTDITAGEYIAIGTGYVCVSTTPEANSANNEILMNDNIIDARRYVLVNDGEYVQLQGDIKLYSVADAPKVDTSGKIPSGQYKCGSDIVAGEYKITLEPKGYFAVSKDTRRNITHNKYSQDGGSYYATLNTGEYLQIKQGVGEFVKAVEAEPPKPVPVQKPVVPQKVLNLGMTFEQFRSAYNAKIIEYAPETGWDVSGTELITGEQQDIFLWQFMERVALMGMVDKSSGLIKKMVVMALPQNQTDYEGAMLAYGLAIAVLSPELNYGQRSKLLEDLHIFDELYATFMDIKQRNYNALRGNVKYQTDYIAEKGALHFWASAKDL